MEDTPFTNNNPDEFLNSFCLYPKLVADTFLSNVMIYISKQVCVHKYIFFIFTDSPNPSRNSNFRLKCWKQMLQNSFAILYKSNIQCCSLQTFLNVRIKLYTYTLSVLLLLNHSSFYFQRPGFTMGRVTDQFSSYLSRRCFSPSASSGTTTITKVRFD